MDPPLYHRLPAHRLHLRRSTPVRTTTYAEGYRRNRRCVSHIGPRKHAHEVVVETILYLTFDTGVCDRINGMWCFGFTPIWDRPPYVGRSSQHVSARSHGEYARRAILRWRLIVNV